MFAAEQVPAVLPLAGLGVDAAQVGEELGGELMAGPRPAVAHSGGGIGARGGFRATSARGGS